VLLELASHGRQRADDVLRDGGLFGDDQGLHSSYSISRSAFAG
jgi:hypothetical protein